MYKKIGKRSFDLGFALLLFLILLPVFLLISLCLLLTEGRPIFFRQQRPGLHGKLFTIFKFRTMLCANNSNLDELPPESERLTKLGNFLRKSSLDELPELLNILRGDMSFVGPRPLLKEYLSLYSPEQAKRHSVRPGITGWAQINGRNTISWQTKFNYDLEYVKHCSLWFDLKIIMMTGSAVLLQKNISESPEISMSRFTGNN